MSELRIGIIGCGGRMGQTLAKSVAAAEGCALAGGTERPGSPAIGRDVGAVAGLEPVGAVITDDPSAMFASVDAVIDFTAPAATVEHARLAAEHGTILVVGTTGLDGDQEAVLAEAGERTRVVYAPNMSVGVTLLLHLVEQVAATLGDDYDIEIVEMHHRHKVDAPSGTALGLAKAAAKGRGVDLDAVADRGRDGLTGPRERGAIGMAALRGGDVVGDHTVMFATDGERIELGHKASSRETFSRGAVRAALWAKDRAPGLYAMRDVLGI